MNKNIKTPLLGNTKASAIKSIDWKFMIFLGFVFIFSVLGLVGFIFQMKSIGDMDRMEKNINNNTTTTTKQTSALRSQQEIAARNMKRGDQGPPGIQGPPGPTGGVHAGAGPLLCVGQKKVATPTVGTSPYSIIYLDNRRYTPIQYWTMKNNPDGTVSVVNKFTGNCMTTDNSDIVYSDPCKDPAPPNQKFIWKPNMQLSSSAKQNYCITVDNFDRNTSNSNNSFNLDDCTEKKESNNGTVTQLKLSQCSDSQNLDQTWWIGN